MKYLFVDFAWEDDPEYRSEEAMLKKIEAETEQEARRMGIEGEGEFAGYFTPDGAVPPTVDGLPTLVWTVADQEKGPDHADLWIEGKVI